MTSQVSWFQSRCIPAHCFPSMSQVMVHFVSDECNGWSKSSWFSHSAAKSLTMSLNWMDLVSWLNRPGVNLHSQCPYFARWLTTSWLAILPESFCNCVSHELLILDKNNVLSSWWDFQSDLHDKNQSNGARCHCMWETTCSTATVSTLTLFVAVSPSQSSRCPPAVIQVLHRLSIFSGQHVQTICGLVTFSSYGTCQLGVNSQTSMPLVSLNPWNRLPSYLPTDFSQQAWTCGSGWLCGSCRLSHFFSCSSQM